MNISQVEMGKKYYIQSSFGNGRLVVGTITEIDNDIKNGIPGVGYEDEDGEGFWAYDHQVKKAVDF